jgi:DNA polymerase I
MQTIEGFVIDADYVNIGRATCIRLTVRATDGKVYELVDREFMPYFYLLPNGSRITEKTLVDFSAIDSMNNTMRAKEVTREKKRLLGREVELFRITMNNPSEVPKFSEALMGFGQAYENDIPFARRYIIDKDIIPLDIYTFEIELIEGKEGRYKILNITDNIQHDGVADKNVINSLNIMCFDIETYNPTGMPRPDKDPIVMISYAYFGNGREGNGVLTFKKLEDKKYDTVVETLPDEKSMIGRFVALLDELDIDIVSGYNSTNFDIKYMLDRAAAMKLDLNLSRFHGDTRIESHGLISRVKMAGRAHIDIYNVVRFVALVAAQESILKLNSYTLKNVYEAMSGEKKKSIDRAEVFKLWDGTQKDLETLVDYNLSDSMALRKVFETLIPITIEVTRTTGNVISDIAVSTTSQLVEFLMMRYARKFNELIPNKPSDSSMRARMMVPYEGAYVKTPEPGIYDNIVIFDFRGLYPSIIISHNIDPSSICTDCTDYFESPIGIKFMKKGNFIGPTLLRVLINQRSEIKKLYKKDKSILLGARSQALKILANSFYGYLGYARARWYSKECASSVTAYGRQYIHEAIDRAEADGLKVLYSDTDSVVVLLNQKTKDDALAFMKKFNSTLPELMELEFEDFYTRGVFVGKKADKDKAVGAKKKYALISESGHIKIRGFELVRRDWSKIAQETQKRVLEIILKEGSAEKAAEVVKETVKQLRAGKVPLSELVISTQLSKSISSYDIKSPELNAAKKAVESGFRTRDEMEKSVIGYIITKSGKTISDRALLYGMAKDYDPEYYINNQVLPATMRILKELDFDENELKDMGKQRKL